MEIKMKDYNLDTFSEKDFYNWDEIISKIEELECENKRLEENLNSEKEIRNDFFVEKSLYTVYGLNESDFH